MQEMLLMSNRRHKSPISVEWMVVIWFFKPTDRQAEGTF